ncbi:MAG: tetratricopeptide repeat protein [Desulfobacterales bacterium]|jgi:tetratricopeptide (TPR) repeat protein|nr:tetratricopeptide repeat protein [Desulfobacterales bacterium]MDH3877242.1 tetratricopeptide repeat protein [Desulfobacterales bacterium]
MNKNTLAVIITLSIAGIVGFYFYKYSVLETIPGQNKYRLGNKYLEDGKYEKALQQFDEVLVEHREYKEAHLAKAITLLQMERFGESRESFNIAIGLDNQYAQAYANRGILNDRVGQHEAALRDYRKALELNPELAEGPGFLWRFLRNIPEPPPTIADRADYLEEELKKPEGERLIQVPELDSKQRMYKK